MKKLKHQRKFMILLKILFPVFTKVMAPKASSSQLTLLLMR